jgi:hypothetical protein
MRLSRSLANAPALPDGGFDEVVRMAKTIPGYAMRYGDFAQIGTSIERLLATCARSGR